MELELAPAVEENLPAAQGAHVDEEFAPSNAENLPTSHGVHEVA